MKFWTIQDKDAWPMLLKTGEHRPAWPLVSPAWLEGAKFMARELEQRGRGKSTNAPAWLWAHDLGASSPPTVGWAQDFNCCDESLEQENECWILDVPEEFVVLTSYDLWCAFMGDLSGRFAKPDPQPSSGLFETPMLRREGDCLQGVVDHIRREWIVERRAIRVTDRDRADLI